MSTARERQRLVSVEGSRGEVSSQLIPNGEFLTDEQEKAKKLNSYFATIVAVKGNENLNKMKY